MNHLLFIFFLLNKDLLTGFVKPSFMGSGLSVLMSFEFSLPFFFFIFIYQDIKRREVAVSQGKRVGAQATVYLSFLFKCWGKVLNVLSFSFMAFSWCSYR